jgi:hypothetical protein
LVTTASPQVIHYPSEKKKVPNPNLIVAKSIGIVFAITCAALVGLVFIIFQIYVQFREFKARKFTKSGLAKSPLKAAVGANTEETFIASSKESLSTALISNSRLRAHMGCKIDSERLKYCHYLLNKENSKYSELNLLSLRMQCEAVQQQNELMESILALFIENEVGLFDKICQVESLERLQRSLNEPDDEDVFFEDDRSVRVLEFL